MLELIKIDLFPVPYKSGHSSTREAVDLNGIDYEVLQTPSLYYQSINQSIFINIKQFKEERTCTTTFVNLGTKTFNLVKTVTPALPPHYLNPARKKEGVYI